jgi:hypothetical protein
MWRELQNTWDIENLALWKRPLAYGTTSEPLMLAVVALALLLVVHVLGRDDYLSPVAAGAVLLAGALQALMGLGHWLLAFTIDDRFVNAFGLPRGRFDARDLAERLPYVAIALLIVVVAGSLIRDRNSSRAESA